MKVLNFTAFSLAVALALSSSLLVSRDRTAVDAATVRFQHTATWDAETFDEALWLAIDEVATMEEFLPPSIERFYVTMHPAQDSVFTVELAFNRAALLRLKDGDLAPEQFVREYVDFN